MSATPAAGGDLPISIDPEAEYVLSCDGASRGNPGPASIGFVLDDDAGNELLAHGEALGASTTNNVAEYAALQHGLQAAGRLGVRRLRVRMDSELVVRQMLGRYKVRHPGLRPLYEVARKQAHSFESFRIEHVPRTRNRRADALAKRALDDLISH
ncbi:MAG: ribonuclease HI family protein [Candidatus Krumholzibacteriia bacterium]